MDTDAFEEAVKGVIDGILGAEKFGDGSKSEAWKNDILAGIDSQLEKMLPSDKIFKTGTDVLLAGGSYGMDTTATMIQDQEKDYFITFYHVSKGNVLTLVCITCFCVGEAGDYEIATA